MKILYKGVWSDIPLDYARQHDEHYIVVKTFINLAKITDAYFQRPNDIRLAINYAREIGIKPTLTKIISRSRESLRNDKFMSVGFGYIDGLRPVYFVAPMHPQCIDIVCLPKVLMHEITEDSSPIFPLENRSILRHVNCVTDNVELTNGLQQVIGWNNYSGTIVPQIDWQQVKTIIQQAAAQQKGLLLNAGARLACTSTAVNSANTKHLTATLLGYGNYAKTVIFPNLPSQLRITRIHDVDPLQIPAKIHRNYSCSTEPGILENDDNQVFFIAGFHHTHAELACEGLRRNAHLVVEKPLVTSLEQLGKLELAFKNSAGSYFSCFHKRYMAFNPWVRQDLNIGPEEPINYHAVVYEVPLPNRHWYRWPNSRSRVVSNGCHWLDHFLYLNNFASVEKSQAFYAPDGTLNISVVLNNSAFFSMILTDTGSPRLGVQDYVELRQRDATVIITNGSHYRAENQHRTLRQVRKNRLHSYGRMYREIGKSILAQQPGDTWNSIAASSNLALAIDAMANDHEKIAVI